MLKLKKTLPVLIVAAAIAVSGCSNRLSSMERREYSAYKEAGLVVKEKSPGLGAVLGILPGGGSFYSRQYGSGIVGLLFWPTSVLWEPIAGYTGSNAVNYDVTKAHARRMKRREIDEIEDKLIKGEIDNVDYVRLKSRITDKYEPY